MTARHVRWGVLLIFVAACKSDQQKADDRRQTIASWRATVRMADSAYARHDVPRHFIEQLHDIAREEIAQAARQ